MAVARTSIRLPSELLRAAKARAVEEGTTVTALIERGLREQVERPLNANADRRPGKLVRYGGSGTMPGVDIYDNAGLRDLLDEDSCSSGM